MNGCDLGHFQLGSDESRELGVGLPRWLPWLILKAIHKAETNQIQTMLTCSFKKFFLMQWKLAEGSSGSRIFSIGGDRHDYGLQKGG